MATLLQDQASLPAHPKSLDTFVRALPSSPDDMEHVWAWNETQPTLVYECAHALIKKQVHVRPDKTAVYAHDATFSFKQLDDLSTRLAHLLVELGIEPEDIVPLCFEKSAWAIVGILGVVKAGAAFVFIDPSHPANRRDVMMNQIGAKLIISSSQQAALWKTTVKRTIKVDRDFIEKLPVHGRAPSTNVTPSNLLYVIFTSGSTGTPKGCLIEHSAFCSGSLQHAAKACISPSSRVLQLASFVFDVSILEILTSLISGACICLPSTTEMMLGPAHLINDMAITWAFLTPSLAKMIKPSDVPNLKTLALGGEPLAKVDVETWAGHLQLINGYGPSECSIAASGNTHMMPDTDPANIGWAVGGLCWIVDSEDQDKLIPIGGVGELLIEGPILARGYLENQAKTDEVFIESPEWGPRTNAGKVRRLYKTGDLAKFNPDGSLHFVGRKDTQVKLRGLRIELGEIEHHIANHNHIEHKMVILPKTGRLKEQLVAIVSLSKSSSRAAVAADSQISMLRGTYKAEADSQTSDVRAHLATMVPEYMVPEVWVTLERFPLLMSGKLNRSMIQKWVHEVDEATYAEIADLKPRDGEEEREATPLESKIRELYAAILNIPIAQISLSRSFLSLGGDSITAMQVMSRCRVAGIAITVKDLLRSKSISELSLCAGLAGESIYSKEEIFDTDFDLSPIQRMYFKLAPESNDDAADTHFNQSFFLRLTRTVSEANLTAALQAVVSRHSMLRARFDQDADGKWMQRVLPEVAGTYSFATHAVGSEQDVAPIMEATQLSLHIRKGPVFAVNLFQTANEGQLLLLVAHHVMVDLVSWRTIIRNLEEVLATGALEIEKPIPFQNWLRLQAEHEAQRRDPCTALPFQIPAPRFEYWGMLGKSNIIGDTVEQRFRLDKEATARLLGDACHTALHTEPLHLLLSALIHSFRATFSDRALPALFREGHGREPWDENIDLSETVGWFTTMYPLYVEPGKEEDIVQIIKRVKDISHSVPDNGRPYFASRYLNDAGVEAFGDHEQVEISFDYLGLYQQLERPNALLQQVPGYEATAGDVGRDVPRFSLVEITAEMILGQMQLSFVFNRHMKNQDRLQAWVRDCKQSLVSATEKLIGLQREYTLADFPLLSLTYDGLDDLLSHRILQLGIPDVECIQNIYPCSPMQHGLIIAQSRSVNGYYEYYHTMKIEAREPAGSVDLNCLQKAWENVVQRHSSLRTVFIESVGKDGLYDQLVLKKISARVKVVDCGDDKIDGTFSNQEPIAFRSNEAPHRLTLCKLTTGAVFCRLDINHAIVDGASIANIVGDLVLAYDGKLSSKPGFLFENYIAYILKHPAASTLDFWGQHLNGVKPCLFPTMAHLEDAGVGEKHLKTANIDIGMLPATLAAFCSGHNVTLVNLFQLAWALVLRAFTDSEDVCFGYLSTGRDVPLNGIEEGVGAFITMLICRLDLRDAPSVNELLDRVADDFTRSLPNQYCDLASIQHSLDLAGQPLFNTIMSFHRDDGLELLEESSINIESLDGHDPTEYALAVDVGVSECKTEIMLGYWTSEFTDKQVSNIGSTFAKALECVVQQPANLVKEIDLVSENHVRQMHAFNSIVSEAIERCIHDVIQEQVEAQPNREAISSWEGSWTYRELDEAATRLAHYLISLGAGPEKIIPYCFPKSAWAIVSILAILKAGSAGVAFDPDHPVQRLRGLAEEVDATIVLAAPQTACLFDTFHSIQSVVSVDASFVNGLPSVAGPACTTVRPNNTAFVVFTSGTTGKPKGIVLEHSSVCTSAAAMGPVLDIGPGTRVAQFAAYTFDVSLQDILTTLQHGGTLCVISDYQKMNNLAEGINSTQANWADVTSTVAGLLRPTDVPTLRRLNTGGEPLTREVVNIWADDVELYNLYGPAETTINHTCSKRLSKDSCANNIGKSYGASAWIVDEHNPHRLVPLGCIGELLIEGPLLARHYLNEPAKTSAAFIENPAWVGVQPSSLPPRRFYKSGDLCSFNTDGSLNIVGRRDGQIKINGQRVELDEIMFQVQSRLSTDQQAVIDAVDIEEHARSKTIIAYIYAADYSQSADDPRDISIPITDALGLEFRSLQASLAQSLPRYMIPSMYIPITRVPITQSAKLDRVTLRRMVSGFSKEQFSHYMLLNSARLPPTTEMEFSIQSLWSQVLGIEDQAIGANDNFFRLGGDSVGAMKLVAAARARKITLSVAHIFASPTLSDMAVAARTSTNECQKALTLEPFSLIKDSAGNWGSILEEASGQCGVSEDAVQNCYPTTALQEGLMALSMRRTGAYLAQKAFRLPEDLDLALFQKAWAAVVETEDILRTRIVHTQRLGSVQVVVNTTVSWTSATDMETYLVQDMSNPVQYGGPLIRLAIVQQANGDNYFIWTAHHALYDGWTVTLLFDKVAKMYTSGITSPSAAYANFIGHISEIEPASRDEFWHAQFASVESQPTGFPIVPLGYQATSKQNMSYSARVSKTSSSSITTPIMMRAAWAMVIATYSDSNDVIFATTLSGRNVPLAGIDTMMGPTITTVPIRIALPNANVLVEQYLESVQSQSIEMMPYEQTGLQSIRQLSSEAHKSIDQIQTLLVVQSSDASEDVPSFLGMESLSRPSTNFDTYALVVECCVGREGVFDVQARYDDSIVSAELMKRMLQQFEHVLKQFCASSSSSLGQLELLSYQDLQAIKTWNRVLPEVIDKVVQDQIAEQTLINPDAAAICAWDGTVTYRELDDHSTRLAKHLIALGVGLEVKVGVCFDKSKWNVISMLAVLKAGGTCVQLLPTYPGPRMLSILKDIEATVVLVAPKHTGLFDDIVDNIVAVQDELFGSLFEEDDKPMVSTVQTDNAAFIVFTSGSTGKPKGVVIEHRGFCTMTHYQSPRINLGPQARVLQFASHSFDICLFETFATLICGGCVCIPSEEDRMNNLTGAINKLDANWLIMVSTVADTFRPEEVPGVENVILGGEPLRPDIHARWANSVNLFNDYGPAECSILAVMTESTTKTPPSMIGKGLGCRTWVTHKDDHNTLMPIGCIGELLVEGPLVARGYLHDTVKTDAAYISAPTWSEHITPKPMRLYKTGDLVRYDDNGNLLCIGRKDTQIKIRGLRVELGEIEHHIKTSDFHTEHLAVEKILQQGEVDKPTLAAFIVSETYDPSVLEHGRENILLPVPPALTTKLARLQDQLSLSLQSYMVPTLYVLLKRMPETQTGKIDRKALRQIGADLSEVQLGQCSLSDAGAGLTRIAPTTPREMTMQAVWAEVLDVSQASIGANDSFFKKGGDSVRAMRLAAAARRAGLTITVAEIFSNPVFCHMAAAAKETATAVATATELEPFSLAPVEDRDALTSLVQDAARCCKVGHDKIEDIYPCTPLQEGMIALSLQSQNAYMAQRVFRLPEDMDVERFKDSWQQLVAIHPVLRTRIIPAKSSGALQVVIKEGITWQHPTASDEYLEKDKEIPINYGSSLTRFAIDVGRRYFVWTVHHALYDGFSANVLFSQLKNVYICGSILRPVGYTRFIKTITAVDTNTSASFWRSQLGGGAPTSFPTPPTATYQPRPNMELKRSIVVRRRNETGIMMSTVLRAAWAITTAKYMDTDDVVFGVTLSGRNAAVEGVDEIIAPTITTVPVRVQLDRAQKLPDFLAEIQRRATEMVPFEHTGLQYIHKLGPDVHAALALKNLFVVQQPDGKTVESDFLNEVHDPALLRGFHTYAVVIECLIKHEEVIELQAQFDQEVISETQMSILLTQFEYVVTQLNSGDSDRKLGNIDLFGLEDMQKVLKWNGETEIEIVDDCVHRIFKKQVAIWPEAQAICAWDGSLTYLQLDVLSDRLASCLVSKGIQPEVLVPLCFDKSVWTVVTMLAVLKAGGACVHLGATQPITRLAQIIKDTGAKLLLADRSHSEMFQGLVEVITIESSFIENLSSAGPLPLVSPTNPAFVLFTSGSTGKPKGIVVEHGSLCTSSKAHGSNRKVGPHTRLLQFAAYTFDVSVADVFTTLQRGGCICVPSEEERINDLAGAIDRMNVNYAFLTPTVAGLLEPSNVPGLRTLILGGEMLTQDNIQTWAPAVNLIISYGMAECSIHCVDAVPLTVKSNPANLGHSSGCLMWIVERDNHNKLAPVGCVGELVIEGRMVARGYLSDKAKTKAAFIEDPAWALSGVQPRRMYKTGDLVKYGEDGAICYISRKDFQIKHHGQRIELGEIEHHLLTDSQVRHAIVLLPKSGYSKNRLVGVLSLHAINAPTGPVTEIQLVEGLQKGIAELQLPSIRSSLAATVPDYMIPAIWIIIDAIPLTANGKMDRVRTRQWLENLDESTYKIVINGNAQDGSDVATTHEEEQLQKIVSKALGLPIVNLNRSFLDLGGDSITAMQLKAKCHTEDIELTIRDILTCKSISELTLKARFGASTDSDMEEILDAPFALTPCQQVYLDNMPDIRDHNQLNYQSLLLRLTSTTTVYKLVRAVEAVVQRHSMLKARFAVDDENGWTQKITKDVAEAYRFEAHAVTRRDQMLDVLCTYQSILHIKNRPVFFVHLFNIGTETDVQQQFLFLSAHPLIADTESLYNIVHDMEQILVSGRLLTQKPLSFQTWARLLRERARTTYHGEVSPSNSSTSNTDYWGMNGLANVFGDTVEQSITLGSRTTSLLLGASNNALRTQPVDILLSVMAHSFERSFKDRTAPPILCKGQGREFLDAGIDLSDVVGCFESVFQMYVPGNDDVVEIMRQVKDARVRCSKFGSLGWHVHSGTPSATTKDEKNSGDRSHLEILLEYNIQKQGMGDGNGLFHFESLPKEQLFGKGTKRQALVEISAKVVDGEMRLYFIYNRRMSHKDQIKHWIQRSEVLINETVDRLQDLDVKHTLSDFPLLPMSYAQLTELEETLSKIGVKPADVTAVLPCSPIQYRMLQSQRRIPGTYQSDTWHAIRTPLGSSPVDERKLQVAWQKIVDRHEALRTIFISSIVRPGEFDQVVIKERRADVRLIECEDSAMLKTLENYAAVDYGSARPHSAFTLFRGPGKDVYCKLEISHALQDGMSTRVIYRDLALAYQDLLPSEPTAGFRDYVSWLQQQDLSASVDYWTQRLENVRPCCLPRSPVDRNIVGGAKHEFIPVELEADMSVSLADYCKRNGVRLATVFQTAWALVLRAFTRSKDVLFGYMTANRDVPIAGIADVVGPLINMLLCRLKIEDGMSVEKLLRDVAGDFVDGVEHQFGFVEAVRKREEQMSVYGVDDEGEEALWNTVMSLEYAGEEEREEDSSSSPPSSLVFEAIGGVRSPEFDVVIGVLIHEMSNVEIQIGYWDHCIRREYIEELSKAYVGFLDLILRSPPERRLEEV